MSLAHRRPRFWVPGFDSAHLAAPALLLLTVILLATAPIPPAPVLPSPPRIAVRPLAQASILNPTSGTILTVERFTLIEGVAQPGAVVQLYWTDRPLGPPAVAGPDGRWHFTTRHFPTGRHVFRVVAQSDERRSMSAPVIVTVQAAVPPQTPVRKAKRPR